MENNFKGTQGEWIYFYNSDGGYTVKSKEERLIVATLENPTFDYDLNEDIANAKLISAAPELLEALQNIIEIGKRDMANTKYDGYFDAAIKAIRKATE